MNVTATFQKLVSLVAMLVFAVTLSTPVQAQSHKTFRFESEHPNKLEIIIYSDDRKGHQWPGSGRVYVLDTDEVTSFKVGCLGGERVCYGAWVSGNSSTYWGVGRGNKYRCSKCCYVCDGQQTPIISLDE
jgi:hypothetical protein